MLKGFVKSTLTDMKVASNPPPKETLGKEPSPGLVDSSEEEEVSQQGEPESEFCDHYCPVRALRYYHRYMPEHPELRKGRCHFCSYQLRITMPERSFAQPQSLGGSVPP